MNFKTTKLPLLIGAATVLIAGCENTPDNNEAFFTPESGHSMQAIMDRQAEVGAASDGTLYAFHFDGDVLNSLGRQKIEQIERGTPLSSDVRLYVDLDVDDDATAARKSAVSAYLAALNVPTDRIALVDGPNPKAYPVAKSLRGAAGQQGEAGDAAAALGAAAGDAAQSSGPM